MATRTQKQKNHEQERLANDITLVVATYNSISILQNTLPLNLNVPFGAIVIIDGESTDGTVEFVESIRNHQNSVPIKLISTPRKSLANARNIGTREVKTKYTMQAGPDSVFDINNIIKMLRDAEKYDHVSCQVRLFHLEDYLDNAHDTYKKRYIPGRREVVGAPYIGKTELYLKHPLDESISNSGSYEFCKRLSENGYSIYRSKAIGFEVGFNDIGDIYKRWIGRGEEDVMYYSFMKQRWNFIRRIKFWCRPAIAEMIETWRALTYREYLYCLPFIILVCSLRYWGWIRHLLFKR